MTFAVRRTELGENYAVSVALTTQVRSEEWAIVSPAMSYREAIVFHQQLSVWAGAQIFLWSPDGGENVPLRAYTTDKWNLIPAAPDLWTISATFTEAIGGECIAYAEYLDEGAIGLQLSGALTFLQTYTRDTKPMLANAQGVTVNAFHDVAGRRNYFPSSAGTSEGQSTAILACCKAYAATGNNAWRTLAINYANAYVNYFYMAPIPANPWSSFWIPHWLINAKEPFTAKGAIAPEYRNSGHYDVVIAFTNGIGQVPAGSPHWGDKLADVYKVYSTSGALLWRNIYSPLVSGTEYPIAYWIEQGGIKYDNVTGQRSASAEPVGRIVLRTNYTGQAKLIYSSYTGVAIAKNQGFDAYPVWRDLRPGEKNAAFDSFFWSWEAFNYLFAITGDAQWQRARDATKVAILNTGNIQNLGYLFRKELSTDPFIYPGTQLISNHPTTPIAVREPDGRIRVDVAAAPANTFPFVAVQNFAVQVDAVSGMTIAVELGHTMATIVCIDFITDNAFSPAPDKVYRADYLTQANAMTNRSFVPADFVRWGTGTWWYPRCAQNPIYLYTGGGAIASFVFTQLSLDGLTPVAAQITLIAGNTYAGAGLVLIHGKPIAPPPMVYAVGGAGVTLKITDSANVAHRLTLAPTSGLVSFPGGWAGFDGGAPAAGEILNIEFEAIADQGATTIQLYYAGNAPIRLPVPSKIWKTGITGFDTVAHSLWIGDVRPMGNPANTIRYQPGVVAFTVNTIGAAIDAWRGSFYAGYQLGCPQYYQWGETERLTNTLQFLKDSQDEYTKQSQSNLVASFMPNFLPAYWDSGLIGEANSWTFDGADPNTAWGPYSFRTLASVAEYWSLNKRDRTAQLIVMRFLGWLDRWYSANPMPPTDFPPIVDPQSNYPEPHAAALIARAALYANLAGGNRAITFRVLKRSIDFINSQYVGSGLMAGSWSASQPSFPGGYREYFLFWHCEIIDTLSLILLKKAAIALPSCSTML